MVTKVSTRLKLEPSTPLPTEVGCVQGFSERGKVREDRGLARRVGRVQNRVDDVNDSVGAGDGVDDPGIPQTVG